MATEIVQQVGAYAGIAAIFGLALLSALYFSQARDLRRLRAWAEEAARAMTIGGAARPAEGAARVQSTSVVQRAPQVVPTPSSAAPTPATPAAAATAAAAAATSRDTAPARPDAVAAGAAPAGVGAGAAAGGNGADAPTPPSVRQTIPIRPPTPAPALEQTMVMRPPVARRRFPALPRPKRVRWLAIALLAVAVAVTAAVAGYSLLAPPERQPAASRVTERAPARKAIVPARIRVAVLNGTTVPGLAAQIGDRLSALGFDVGNITNNADQQRAESVVLFQPGHEREAAFVGRKLGIMQREPIDPVARQLGGDATVVVIAGADQTP